MTRYFSLRSLITTVALQLLPHNRAAAAASATRTRTATPTVFLYNNNFRRHSFSATMPVTTRQRQRRQNDLCHSGSMIPLFPSSHCSAPTTSALVPTALFASGSKAFSTTAESKKDDQDKNDTDPPSSSTSSPPLEVTTAILSSVVSAATESTTIPPPSIVTPPATKKRTRSSVSSSPTPRLRNKSVKSALSESEQQQRALSGGSAVVTPDSSRSATVTRKKSNNKRSTGQRGVKNDTISDQVDDTTTTTIIEDSVKSPKKMELPEPPKAPEGWEEIYSLVEELRRDRTAPCDHSGAEALADRQKSPKEFRFQVLMSLMLSSQTKDAVVGDAIRRMKQDNVLTPSAIHEMDAEKLNNHYISKVGFHNNKTKYIKQVVEILLRNYDGDIPDTADKMMQLPGVGPKMAYICESIAWNTSSGIGVDTHMHRLFNLLGWVQATKQPEQTRLQLEAWLPREYWGDVNLLWVGFGQEVQQFQSKILRKALDCSRPLDALKLIERCGLDYKREAKKSGMEEEVKKVLKHNE